MPDTITEIHIPADLFLAILEDEVCPSCLGDLREMCCARCEIDFTEAADAVLAEAE